MNNKIKKAVNISKTFIWPLLFMISQLIITSIFTFFFNEQQLKYISAQHPSLTTQEQNNILLEYIKTHDYNTKLTQYISDQTVWILLISAIIFLPLLIKVYQKLKPQIQPPITIQTYSRLIMIGITSAIGLNIIIYLLNTKLNFTNTYDITTQNYIIALISSGIIGPILEELLFRGIVYEKLKQTISINKATILSVMIFAIFHQSPSQIIYAVIMGTILIKIYQKTNIIGSIIVHISANTIITILMSPITTIPIIPLLILTVLTIIIFQKAYKNVIVNTPE